MKQTRFADESLLRDNPALTDEQRTIAKSIFDFTLDVGQCLTGYWTLSVMKPDGPPKTAFIDTWDQQKLLDACARAAVRNTQGYGVHFGMAGRRELLEDGRRGGDDDVTDVMAFWCDVDNGDWDGIVERYTALNMPPTFACFTGRGYHLYWLMKVATPADAKAQRTLTRLAQEMGADEAAGRISTMIRVPGTIKYKLDDSFQTRIVDRDFDNFYWPQDFEWLDPGPEPKRIPRPFVKKEDTERIALTAADIAARCDGIQKGKEWYCRCPVPTHGAGRGDRGRSMEVRDGNKGVVITCFAECSTQSIVEALGLNMRDLMRDDSRPATRAEIRARGLGLFGVDTE